MGYSRAIDVVVVQKWLIAAWLIIGGPVIVAALPLTPLEPLRKVLWPLLRRGKLLDSHEAADKGLLLENTKWHRVGLWWSLQKFTVPQSFFTHFYVLGFLWNSVLLSTTVRFAMTFSPPLSMERNISSVAAYLTGAGWSEAFGTGSATSGREAWRLAFLLLLVEVHLVRRMYECLFISSFNPYARMTLFGYFGALGYYVMLPLTLFLQSFRHDEFAVAFQSFLTHKSRGHSTPMSDSSPDFSDVLFFLGRLGWMPYLGAVICLYGFIHQHTCHKILAALRPDGEPESGKRYSIPRGDWFELVSSAHYLAEIVIYAGLLVASGGSHPAVWILFLGVVANLYLVAKPTHEWYLSKFDNYPKTRRALFPYIC